MQLDKLLRVESGKIAERWDVLSVIPPENRCKNTNGPFLRITG
jgi:predicted SnoaL-like aldol condensation-catalyzing enzyme